MIWGIVVSPVLLVAAYEYARGRIGAGPYAMAGATTGTAAVAYGAGSFAVGFGVAVLIAGMMALCVLLAWLEHKTRLGEAIERALTEEGERVAMLQRRRFVAYLRDQSHVAEQLAKCGVFGAKGADQEMYLANVLDELAHDVAFGAADVGANGEVQS